MVTHRGKDIQWTREESLFCLPNRGRRLSAVTGHSRKNRIAPTAVQSYLPSPPREEEDPFETGHMIALHSEISKQGNKISNRWETHIFSPIDLSGSLEEA